MATAQNSAPTTLSIVNVRRGIFPTPAMTGVNVRTTGTNRARFQSDPLVS
jgi:hypothetical protein